MILVVQTNTAASDSLGLCIFGRSVTEPNIEFIVNAINAACGTSLTADFFSALGREALRLGRSSIAGPASPRRTTSCRSSSTPRRCRRPTTWPASTAPTSTGCTSACPRRTLRPAPAGLWPSRTVGGNDEAVRPRAVARRESLARLDRGRAARPGGGLPLASGDHAAESAISCGDPHSSSRTRSRSTWSRSSAPWRGLMTEGLDRHDAVHAIGWVLIEEFVDARRATPTPGRSRQALPAPAGDAHLALQRAARAVLTGVPHDVVVVLAALASGMQDGLRDNLVAVYPRGSLATGDFITPEAGGAEVGAPARWRAWSPGC